MTRFPLEGAGQNLIAALSGGPQSQRSRPTYPDLHQKLFPALQAMASTLEALGPRPTPEDVDRSNLRRLLRAVRPILIAYGDAYERRGLARSRRSMDAIEAALGRYKDAAVIAAEIGAVTTGEPEGRAAATKLSALRKSRRRSFQEAFELYRDHDAGRIKAVLEEPKPGVYESEAELHRGGLRRQERLLSRRVDDLRGHGLLHETPAKFHDSRKVLRRLLATCEAFPESAPWNGDPLLGLRRLVGLFGAACDHHTALLWARRKALVLAVVQLKRRYADAQLAALLAGKEWLRSVGLPERRAGR